MPTVPFVTVIMPIRNEASFIERSLGAVLAQDYPHDRMEVLIADGMSDDTTRTIIQQLAGESAIPVTIIDNPGRIVPTGFNLALKQAKGAVIVRVDGHTIIESDYVTQCIDALERTDADNVGGRMNAIGSGTFGEAITLATSSPFGVGGARFHYSQEEEWVDTVYMGAWRREIFDRLGGFNEEFVRNQDDEFNYRLRENGGKILLVPKIRSRYYNRSTPRSLFRQYFQYGMYKVRVMQEHPAQMQIRQFVPPLFTAGVLGGIIAWWIQPLRIIWLICIALYLLANLLVSWRIASREGSRHLPYLPITFLILHLAYGSGFLYGLVKFWNRWNKAPA